MPKYTFDFNLSAWIRDLEIEADSLEEAKEKFSDMYISEMIDEGYVKDYRITDLDIDIEEDEEEEIW